MNSKLLPSLLFIFPVLFILVSAQPIQMQMVSASSSEEDDDQDQDGGGQGIAVGEPDPNAPLPSGNGGGGSTQCQPGDDECGTPVPGLPGPPRQGPLVGQENRATSEQTGGIGAGDIIQRAQGGVNEQLCKTIGGIGNRECQQQADPGAVQDCSAIAGLGRATCVQSENPDGTGTCLTANGRPFICETDTGKAISGSGQAGLGGR